MATKPTDSARQQAASPLNGTSARAPPPNAWAKGTNPITQRTNTPASNGLAEKNGQSSEEQKKAGQRNTATPDKGPNDQMHYLIAQMIGLDAIVTVKDGSCYTGVFSGVSYNRKAPTYDLKMVKSKTNASSEQSNGTSASTASFQGNGDDIKMSFPIQDTVDFQVDGVSFGITTNKSSNGPGFRTDTEISGNLDARERVLQKWEPARGDAVDMSLGIEDSSGSTSWDQFATNERLYNVRSDYNEEMYTTSIDRNTPDYKRKAEKAARLAAEIERDQSTQRGAKGAVDSGLDEEDKYSGVRRETPTLAKGGANAYVPPSKRAISNVPTVSGAPYDPAIISLSRSQNSKPIKPAGAPDQLPIIQTTAPTDTTSNGKAPSEGSQATPSAPAQGATKKTTAQNGDGLYRDVADAFKQFNQAEKLKVQQRATSARQEKSTKLNDLKKFAQNFKLHSRVPDDLVPILAKSKEKQDLIVAKAEKEAREKEDEVVSPPPAPKAVVQPAQPAQPVQPTQPAQPTEAAPDSSAQSAARTKSQQPGRPPSGQGPLRASPAVNPRIQGSFRPNAPSPVPIPSGAPTPGSIPSVTSPTGTAGRFNVKAMEFKPNPTASTFNPTASAASSVKRPSITSLPPAAPVPSPKPATFFSPSHKKSKLAGNDYESLTSNCFSIPARWLERTDADRRKAFAANGGFPQGYRTAPAWPVEEANQDRSHVDMFPKSIHSQSASPHIAGPMPHQHQLPLHLQNGATSANHSPQFYRNQPHPMSQHPEESRMHFSPSAASLSHSPGMTQPPMAFQPQPHQQMAYPYGMPPNMSPAMGMRTIPAGVQYMTPQGAPLGGHVMMQQNSNGPYQPQQAYMFGSPGPTHAQPHFGAPQGMYAGSPRAHPMSHQGSQHGHAAQPVFGMPGQGPMMMMPQHGSAMGSMRGGYGQGQFQGQHHPGAYALQHRAMSNNGFNSHSMTPRQQNVMPHQQSAQQMHPSASTNGEDAR